MVHGFGITARESGYRVCDDGLGVGSLGNTAAGRQFKNNAVAKDGVGCELGS